MEDYHQEVIATDLDRDQLVELLASMMPELEWRRGESEAQGARTVSGRNGLGARVTFWLEDDRPRQVTVEISFRGARPDADGGDAWQQALVDRLRGEVFPAVRADRRPDLAPGVSVVCDLQRVLMPDGEDSVTVTESSDDLTMRIGYTTSDGQPAELIIVFHRAAFHLREPVPGPTELEDLFSIAGLDTCQLADLGPTPFLRQWLDEPANRDRLSEGEANHYFVLFWDAGVAHHIVAASFDVLGDQPSGADR